MFKNLQSKTVLRKWTTTAEKKPKEIESTLCVLNNIAQINSLIDF